MLGCLDDCLRVRLVADLVPLLAAFWLPWVTCGVTWNGPCKLVGAFGPDWLRQGTQLSHLALLCRREHRFREICWILDPECWRPVAGWGQNVGALWRPVAGCCNRVDPL